LYSSGVQKDPSVCSDLQTGVDTKTKLLYNRDKLANNVIRRCCKNTTKKIPKVVDNVALRCYNRYKLVRNGPN